MPKFLRHLLHHRLYTAINVAGLALGIAVFLTMALIVRYEHGFDRALPGGDTLYRVDTVLQSPGSTPHEWTQTSFLGAPFMRADFPAITAVERVFDDPVTLSIDGHAVAAEINYADPAFFTFFPAHVLEGNLNEALASPNRIAITQSLALRYFGTPHALGRTVQTMPDHTAYTIAAVYADPSPNSSTPSGMIAHFPTNEDTLNWYTFHHWGGISGTLWLRIPDAGALPAIAEGLRHYMPRHPGTFTPAEILQNFGSSYLTPIALHDVHFHDASIGVGGVSRDLVQILGLIGVAALAMAAINYVNLATARAADRAREVAMRKVLGATRGRLVLRYLGEAAILTTVSGLIGLSLCELARRNINALGGWSITMDPGTILPLLVLAILATTLAAGLYPAFVLANAKPAPILAASRMPSGGRMAARLRLGLVCVQFAFAIGLGICTLVMAEQAHFIATMQRGFTSDGIVVVQSVRADGLEQRQGDIARRLGAVPGVVLTARSGMYPHRPGIGELVSIVGRPQTHTTLQWASASGDYFRLYGMHLLAGRWLDAAHQMDLETPPGSHAPRNVVLSRTAVQALGLARPEDAIGLVLHDHGYQDDERVVGVMDDPRFGDAHARPMPLLLQGLDMEHASSSGAALHLRYAGVPTPLMMQRLEAAWHEVAPDTPFEAQTVASMLDEDSRSDREHARLFAIGAGVAIGIASLGLYGLSLFTVLRRRHEIGIRKALGARTGDVLRLLVTQFLRPVLLANLIAIPVAWVLMGRWLAGFDQRIALTPLPFLEVAAAALAIGTLTIITQTIRAARTSPAIAMRGA